MLLFPRRVARFIKDGFAIGVESLEADVDVGEEGLLGRAGIRAGESTKSVGDLLGAALLLRDEEEGDARKEEAEARLGDAIANEEFSNLSLGAHFR